MSTFLLHLLLLVSLCALSHASPMFDDHWQPTAPGRLPTSAEYYHGSTIDPASQADGTLNSTSWPSLAPSSPQQLSSSLILRDAGETDVKAGEFVSGTLPESASMHYFSYKPTALNVPFDLFVGIGSCAVTYCDIHVLMNGSPFASSLNATYSWHYYSAIRIDSAHPLSCEYRNIPLADCVYHYTLQAWSTNQQYYTVVMTPPAGVAELTSGQTQSGTLDGGASAYYYVTNGAVEDVMVFALTVTAGDCDLYVSTTTMFPGPTNYTWSSVDDGDDLIVVNGTTAGPSGRPGLYYYVGVYNKRSSSSSSYSVVGSGYSTSGNPLENAWYLQADVPQRDYAMANTYRYYYLYVQGVWPEMTVTLDSLRGDADMSAWNTQSNRARIARLTTLRFHVHAPSVLTRVALWFFILTRLQLRQRAAVDMEPKWRDGRVAVQWQLRL